LVDSVAGELPVADQMRAVLTDLFGCEFFRRLVEVAGLCLYGCFRKPQRVVYRRGPTAVSNDFARVPTEVRDRGGLPTVLGRLPLARWLCVPSLWKAARVRVGKAQTLGMR